MRRRRVSNRFSYTVLFVWSSVVIFPLFWMVTGAFKQQGDIFPNPTYIPWLEFEPTLRAFRTVLTDYRSQVINALTNSVIASLASATAATLLGAFAGYGLTRFSYRLGPLKNDDIAFFFISQRMMPPVAIVFPFLLMYRFLGLLDNPWGLALAYTIFNLPLAVWIMRDAFRAVAIEIEESALVDGCTRLGAFLQISLPLAAPGLVTSFVVCLIFAWNEFLFALILTFRKAQTIPVLIAGQANELGSYWWIMSALGLIAVVPMVACGLLVQRWLVRGLSAGAVHG